jgi:glutaredoxin
MTISTDSPVVFEYLNLLPYGARGGVTRFFMLSQGIDFEEKLYAMGDEWAEEKERLIKSGDNPSGTSPNLFSNGKAHPQHIAVSRYLARIHRVTSGDDYKDYVQDMVADEYQGFRNQWVSVAFGGDEDVKAEYKKGDLVKHLVKFDALYESFKTHDVFLSTSAKTGQPLWGDAAVYGLLRDHVLTGFITVDDLDNYPRLSAMYGAYEKIPAISEWLEKLFEILVRRLAMIFWVSPSKALIAIHVNDI